MLAQGLFVSSGRGILKDHCHHLELCTAFVGQSGKDNVELTTSCCLHSTIVSSLFGLAAGKQ